jgi:hypothetical protein
MVVNFDLILLDHSGLLPKKEKLKEGSGSEKIPSVRKLKSLFDIKESEDLLSPPC